MADDFYEIDFLAVEAKKSGDAIGIRFRLNDIVSVHVVDAGYDATGKSLSAHIKEHYDVKVIDNVVVTHPDGDHAAGIKNILEDYDVGAVWMLRPWLYSSELLPRFSRFTSVDNLTKRLKEVYPNIAEIERIANEKKIPILDPFQGQKIGSFNVLAPSRERYLDLVVDSERTPESASESKATGFKEAVEKAATKVLNLVKAAWGSEVFSTQETSAENEMSVVQYADILGHKVMLTGDAGRAALAEAIAYAPKVGLQLPGLNRFQVPHHGSRRNVSTELLDQILGPVLKGKAVSKNFDAYISSAKEDKDHPRKAVIRAMIHRGGEVMATEGRTIRTGKNAPERKGWVPVTPISYPEDQEAD